MLAAPGIELVVLNGKGGVAAAFCRSTANSIRIRQPSRSATTARQRQYGGKRLAAGRPPPATPAIASGLR